ncbi:MAG: hypothetical protein TRG1_1840 [Flavobacteriaceae bacterium FS1-H7996/R]|nr:MAG: hypothetical protein TRG1_1840 [Flavobacteriaceae bacterium FS1-H7996/R]
MTVLPPTGQNNSDISSVLTSFSAKALQPGDPHPPQLAAGNNSSAFAINGSS